jgi:glycosyltransferase involved in cell wall biosynthesis
MSAPIRIALVITELEVGGAERCLANLAAGLDRNRFAPVVYSLAPRPRDEAQPLVRGLTEAGIATRFVGVRSAWQFPVAVRRLRRMLCDQRPEIVQTFLFHANVVGALAARGSGATRTVFGMRVADPSRRRLIAERTLAARVDRLVCVSRSVADFYVHRGRVPTEKTVVIPNGIDVASYRGVTAADPVALGLPAGRQTVVYVGRLHAQKGLDWLLQLMPQVLSQAPDFDLLMVGQGPERGRLEKQVVSLGIQDRVHFAGWRPDVPAILRASRLLVLPSRWEGMPNAVLEAMASELPVVGTRAEGVMELLGDAAEEQTVASDDRDGFVRTLLDLLGDDERAQRIGQQNRQRAAQHFSLDAMVAAYQQLYESLLRSEKM